MLPPLQHFLTGWKNAAKATFRVFRSMPSYALIASLFLLPVWGQGQTVTETISSTDFTSTALAYAKVTLTPLAPFGDYNGVILSAQPRSQNFDSNGFTSFSNVVSGYTYKLQIFGPYVTTIVTNGIPTGTAGTINFATYLGTSVGQWFAYYYLTNGVVTNGAVVGQFPQFTGTNIHWVTITNQASGGGTPILAGTNVVIASVGGSNQINVPTNAFDYAGAAQAATNGLGTAAFQPSASFQPSSIAATNIISGRNPGDWYLWVDQNSVYHAVSGDNSQSLTNTDFSGLFNTVEAQPNTIVRTFHLTVSHTTNSAGPLRFITTLGHPIVITNSDTIVGEGNPQSIIALTNGDTGPIFQLGSAANAVSGIITIDNLRFEGANGDASKAIAILSTNVSEPVFRRCEFNLFSSNAVWITGPSGYQWGGFVDCWFVSSGPTTNSHAIYIDATGAIRELGISGCKFQVVGNAVAIGITNGAGHITLVNNRFWSLGGGTVASINISGGSHYQILGNHFINEPNTGALGIINFDGQASPVNLDAMVMGNQSSSPSQANLTSIGANVVGVITNGNQINGLSYNSADGSGETNLNASSLANGVVPYGRYPSGSSGTILSNNGAAVVWATSPAGSGTLPTFNNNQFFANAGGTNLQTNQTFGTVTTTTGLVSNGTNSITNALPLIPVTGLAFTGGSSGQIISNTGLAVVWATSPTGGGSTPTFSAQFFSGPTGTNLATNQTFAIETTTTGLIASGTNNITNSLPTATATTKGAALPDGTVTHYLDGTGAWSTPSGGSAPTAGTNIVVVGSAVSVDTPVMTNHDSNPREFSSTLKMAGATNSVAEYLTNVSAAASLFVGTNKAGVGSQGASDITLYDGSGNAYGGNTNGRPWFMTVSNQPSLVVSASTAAIGTAGVVAGFSNANNTVAILNVLSNSVALPLGGTVSALVIPGIASAWSTLNELGARGGSGTITTSGLFAQNVLKNTNSAATNMTFWQTLNTTLSNRLAPATITVTASPFNWTNQTGGNNFVFINGGSASAIAINGTTVFTAAFDETIPLQTNEWVTITYTVAPTMFWKPY